MFSVIWRNCLRRKQNIINTSQTANVRIVRIAGDECAAAGCKTSKKMQGIFCDNKKNPAANCSGSLRSFATQRQIL